MAGAKVAANVAYLIANTHSLLKCKDLVYARLSHLEKGFRCHPCWSILTATPIEWNEAAGLADHGELLSHCMQVPEACEIRASHRELSEGRLGPAALGRHQLEQRIAVRLHATTEEGQRRIKVGDVHECAADRATQRDGQSATTKGRTYAHAAFP